jgi:lipoprotein-anchoring transpeptidase ErfK/SrfK
VFQLSSGTGATEARAIRQSPWAYRIHGTREPWTIGKNVSSGCIRLLNEEIADLYLRTPIGTWVVVL